VINHTSPLKKSIEALNSIYNGTGNDYQDNDSDSAAIAIHLTSAGQRNVSINGMPVGVGGLANAAAGATTRNWEPQLLNQSYDQNPYQDAQLQPDFSHAPRDNAPMGTKDPYYDGVLLHLGQSPPGSPSTQGPPIQAEESVNGSPAREIAKPKKSHARKQPVDHIPRPRNA
jgi:hypothetical protein